MKYTVRPASGPEATTSIGPNGPGPLPITVLAELAADAPLVAPASSGIAARAIVATAVAISRLVLALRLAVAGLDGSARGRARTRQAGGSQWHRCLLRCVAGSRACATVARERYGAVTKRR